MTVAEKTGQYFKGSRVLLTADCCYSGRLNPAARYLEKKGVAATVLSSVVCSGASTGVWIFTESLVDVFRGTLPSSYESDHVDLELAARYMYTNLTYEDNQMSNYYKTSPFPSDYILSERKSLKKGEMIGQYREALYDGTWYRAVIADQKNTTYKIDYCGYGDDRDEWVTHHRMRYSAVKAFQYDVDYFTGQPDDMTFTVS
jgi:hypothetical protein